MEQELINPAEPSNWETSETLLCLLAKSPFAIGILERIGANGWHDPIQYTALPDIFELVGDINSDVNPDYDGENIYVMLFLEHS